MGVYISVDTMTLHTDILRIKSGKEFKIKSTFTYQQQQKKKEENRHLKLNEFCKSQLNSDLEIDLFENSKTKKLIELYVCMFQWNDMSRSNFNEDQLKSFVLY